MIFGVERRRRIIAQRAVDFLERRVQARAAEIRVRRRIAAQELDDVGRQRFLQRGVRTVGLLRRLRCFAAAGNRRQNDADSKSTKNLFHKFFQRLAPSPSPGPESLTAYLIEINSTSNTSMPYGALAPCRRAPQESRTDGFAFDHQLHAFGPSRNHLVERERRRLAPRDRAVEHLAVGRPAGIVDGDLVGAILDAARRIPA